MDILKGVISVILFWNEKVVLFVVILVVENELVIIVVGIFFCINNVGNVVIVGNDEEVVCENILKRVKIIVCFGYINDEEKLDFLLDGKMDIKWCDVL